MEAKLWGTHPDPQSASETKVGKGWVIHGKQTLGDYAGNGIKTRFRIRRA